MGHEKPHERLLPLIKPEGEALGVHHHTKTQRFSGARRAFLGRRHGLLCRRHFKGQRDGHEKDLCEPRSVHNHSPRQEILQPSDGRIRQHGGKHERPGKASGRKLRRRERGGKHHIRQGRGLGIELQGGRRRYNIRLYKAHGEQQNGNHTRDRRRLPPLL